VERVSDGPTDGAEMDLLPAESVNPLPEGVAPATEEDLRAEIERHGRLREPEIGVPEMGVSSYMDQHPTHFDFRADVRRIVNRVQRKLPYRTYANTYVSHPPVYGRKYEFVSVDFWGGGLMNGRYVGYRGKPIGASLGDEVWRALFYDPYLPNLAWIIWSGRMWSRGYGWGLSPAGPPDSDPEHRSHVHCTYVL